MIFVNARQGQDRWLLLRTLVFCAMAPGLMLGLAQQAIAADVEFCPATVAHVTAFHVPTIDRRRLRIPYLASRWEHNTLAPLPLVSSYTATLRAMSLTCRHYHCRKPHVRTVSPGERFQ